jgi:DnaJ-class molecular chaperone
MGMIRNNVSGNMIIEFDVEFPSTLTEEQMRQLEDIL